MVWAGLSAPCSENSSACFMPSSGSPHRTQIISILHGNVCLIFAYGRGRRPSAAVVGAGLHYRLGSGNQEVHISPLKDITLTLELQSSDPEGRTFCFAIAADCYIRKNSPDFRMQDMASESLSWMRRATSTEVWPACPAAAEIACLLGNPLHQLCRC